MLVTLTSDGTRFLKIPFNFKFMILTYSNFFHLFRKYFFLLSISMYLTFSSKISCVSEIMWSLSFCAWLISLGWPWGSSMQWCPCRECTQRTWVQLLPLELLHSLYFLPHSWGLETCMCVVVDKWIKVFYTVWGGGINLYSSTRMQKQVNFCKFEASLVYIESSRRARDIEKSCLKKLYTALPSTCTLGMIPLPLNK